METWIVGDSVNAAPFRGLSTAPAELLPPGALTVADNVVWDNGMLRTRPGLRAQLSSALGPIGAGVTFVAFDGNAYALIVAGGDTDAGIYRWQEGATTATLVSGSVTFRRDAVQFAIYGDYVFISGAMDGILHRYRFQLSFLFESAAGMQKPAYTLTASLVNTPLAELTTTGNYAWDLASGTMTVPDADFSSGDITTAWTEVDGTIELQTGVDAANPGHHFVRLDGPQETMILKDPIAIPVKTNAHYTSAAATGRQAIHFLVSCRMKRDYERESIVVTLLGYDTGHMLIAESAPVTFKTVSFGVGTAGNIETVQNVLTLPVEERSAIVEVKLLVTAGSGNVPGEHGAYARLFRIQPVCTKYTLSEVNGELTVRANVLEWQTGTSAPAQTTPPASTLVPVAQDRLSVALGGAIDFDSISQIAIPYTESIPFDTFPLRIGLRKGSAALPIYTDTLERYQTADGKRYLVTDLSVLTTEERTDITHLEFAFTDDISLSAGYTNSGQVLFTLGDLQAAGRLTADLPVTYRVRECHSDGTESIISPATLPSGSITPSRVKAKGQVIFSSAAPTNGTAFSGTKIEVYRQGGTFTDGLYRQVAQFASGGPFPSGAPWSWNAGTKTFTDDTPDDQLIGAEVLLDHEATPTGLGALATYAGRLVGAVDDRLHLSQATTGRAAGLYWTALYDDEAPDADTQGQVIRVSGEGGFAGGSITALRVHLTRLAVLLPHAVYLLSGDTPPFVLSRYETDSYYGALSARAVEVAGGQLLYLAADGLRFFGGESVIAEPTTGVLSREIEGLLNPQGLLSGPELDASAYRAAFVAVQAGRVFLSAPKPGESTISTLLIYDGRGQLWTRWLTGALTGCLRFASADRVYFTGADGQIYRLGPEWGDTASVGGAVQPVPIEVQSRAYTIWTNRLLAQRFAAEVACADVAPAYTFRVTADGDTAARRWSVVQAPGNGRRQVRRLKVASNVRGGRLVVVLSANTINPVTVHRWQLEASTGAPA